MIKLNNSLKNVIKNNIFLTKLNTIRTKCLANRNNKKFSRMSRREAFEYIYKYKKWGEGNNQSEFFSGDGSHENIYIESYCETVNNFLKNNKINSICDLGCGDFNVASQLVDNVDKYIGVDIVDNIVKSHNKKYGNEKIDFICLDIVQDILPEADLCIIRQVLQHCSNEEIQIILKKIQKYKFAIITEHVTKKEYVKKYNIDKIHGSHTRTDAGSGVYLDEYPFALSCRELLKVPYRSNLKKNEELVTVLICN